jgi:hypothetical protein
MNKKLVGISLGALIIVSAVAQMIQMMSNDPSIIEAAKIVSTYFNGTLFFVVVVLVLWGLGVIPRSRGGGK